MTTFQKFLILIFSLIFIFADFSSCSQNSPQRQFKNDANYFLGLKKLAEGNEKDAEWLFAECAKKGTKYCARKSAEEAAKIGNARERVLKASEFLEKYKDEDTVLFSTKIFESANEDGKIIHWTNDIDFSNCPNELAILRLNALKKKNDSRFESEAEKWFLSRPISYEHFKFFKDNYSQSFSKDVGENATQVAPTVQFRIEVDKKNYPLALSIFQANKDDFVLTKEILSDLGKISLYTGGDFFSNAKKFDEFAKKTDISDEQKFYAHFYAARLYEKTAKYITMAENSYLEAMKCAKNINDGKKFDNAFWYCLNLNLRWKIDNLLPLLKTYCKDFYNAEYYDDFFDTLVPTLLSKGKYELLGDIYKAIDGHATNATTAKIAYIYARLLQEGFAEYDEEKIDAALKCALNSGSDFYYKTMALWQLSARDSTEKFGTASDTTEKFDHISIRLSDESLLNDRDVRRDTTEKILCDLPKLKNVDGKNGEIDYDAEILLEGYMAFGFPEKIYSEYMAFSKRKIAISTKVAIKLARFLNDYAQTNEEYYPMSLRIMANAASKTTDEISKEDLTLLFPKNYKATIEKYCKEFAVPEANMFALVRSESFFDAKISSFAGAVGLTQLMKETAGDIAKKLKISEFDLKDSDTNLRFGTFYLAELYRRCDNKWLMAFFSYNAGISRVRRWQKDSSLSLSSKKTLPFDILLEVIPYEETRGYGRKLVSATAMYSWLYEGKTIQESVGEVM